MWRGFREYITPLDPAGTMTLQPTHLAMSSSRMPRFNRYAIAGTLYLLAMISLYASRIVSLPTLRIERYWPAKEVPVVSSASALLLRETVTPVPASRSSPSCASRMAASRSGGDPGGMVHWVL